MSEHRYRTSPPAISGMPPGIPYIIGNEAAERFSYYGMTAVLMIFMTTALRDSGGALDLMSEPEATKWVHTFMSAVYFFPIFGALISDGLLGKYRTILWLSTVYCLGHLTLAIDDTRGGLMLGLSLIAIGSGGIKPCVSAHVGDQFGETNKHLIERVFGWFYFAINLGSAISTILTPWLRVNMGYHWAFGVPGVLMFIATIVFWMGRNKFVHVPPGGSRFLEETFSLEGLKTVGRLGALYLCVAVFWSLFDQTHSRWITQAAGLDRNLFGWEVLPDQLQSINPLLVMLFIPLFSFVIYPIVGKFLEVTPLRKIGVGFFVAAASYVVIAMIQERLEAGQRPHMIWQAGAYVVLTAAEVMVSITFLEFSYTQAPRTMKSLVMALNLFSVSLGNMFTSSVNAFIEYSELGRSGLEGANYYWFFTGAMFLVAVAFVFIAVRYKGQTYLQAEEPA